MSGKIIVYVTTVTGNLEVKKQQQRIEMVLGNQYKTYEVEYVDTAASEEAKKKMRDLMGDPKGLPPQIFRGDKYLGDFNAFDNAIEDDQLETWLHQ